MSCMVRNAAERKADESRQSINSDAFGRANRFDPEPRKQDAPDGAQIRVDSSRRKCYRR